MKEMRNKGAYRATSHVKTSCLNGISVPNHVGRLPHGDADRTDLVDKGAGCNGCARLLLRLGGQRVLLLPKSIPCMLTTIKTCCKYPYAIFITANTCQAKSKI